MRTCTRCGIAFDNVAGDWCLDCMDVEDVDTGWEAITNDLCMRGHEMTDDNVGLSGGHRYCRKCRSDRRKAKRQGKTLQRPTLSERYPHRAQAITDLWLNGLSDVDIAARLGIAITTVLKWRHTELKLPANSRGGLSGDPEQAKKQIAALVTFNRTPEGRARAAKGGRLAKARGNSAWNPAPGRQGTFVVTRK